MSNKILNSIFAVLAIGITDINSSMAAQTINNPTSQNNSQGTERCYGIVKAGHNDCETATASCAGSSKIDGQQDAWILVPNGLCNKIVGSTLKQS